MPDLRADARRNREELMAVARKVIAEEGVEASLRDIARRAGVGIGTLYRHFPTREALLAEIIDNGLQQMSARGRELSASRPPGEALAAWIAEVAMRIGPYRGLAGTLLGAANDEGSAMLAACSGMFDTGRGLLAEAQAAGEVRSDVSWEDLFTAVAAISGIAVQSGQDAAARILAVYLDGLRLTPASSR